MSENEETLRVYNLCKSQLIVSSNAIIGLRLEAIKVAMDLLQVEDQLSVVDKILAFSDVLYKQEDNTKLTEESEEDVNQST
jgi:hypothetical protein